MSKKLKYIVTIPLGIIAFIILVVAGIFIPFLQENQWFSIFIFVILPMIGLGEFIDRKWGGVKSGMSKSSESSTIANINPDFIKCPNCGKSIKKDSNICGYCAMQI